MSAFEQAAQSIAQQVEEKINAIPTTPRERERIRLLLVAKLIRQIDLDVLKLDLRGGQVR